MSEYRGNKAAPISHDYSPSVAPEADQTLLKGALEAWIKMALEKGIDDPLVKSTADAMTGGAGQALIDAFEKSGAALAQTKSAENPATSPDLPPNTSHSSATHIAVKCPGCDRELKISIKFAGKSGTCNHCQAKITVPAAAN